MSVAELQVLQARVEPIQIRWLTVGFNNVPTRFKVVPGGTAARSAQERFGELLTIRDFVETGDAPLSEDDGPACTRAFAELASRGGGILRFTPGVYKRLAKVSIPTSNIRINVDDDAIIDASEIAFDPVVRGSGAAFEFTGSLAADAAAGATSISVTSATGMAIGQIINIQSDQIVQHNYGFENAYATDVNRIVGIAGTTITLEHRLFYDFDVDGFTATVSAYDAIQRCSVHGGQWRGGGVRQALGNGLGPIAASFWYVDRPIVSGGDFEGFQGYSHYFDGCLAPKAQNLYVEGIPYGLEPIENSYSGFYGPTFNRCRGVLASGINVLRTRHCIDGLDTVGLNELGCYAEKTHRAAFGSHGGVRALLVGNCIARECYAGGVMRAIDGTWTGNDFEAITSNAFNTASNQTGDMLGKLVLKGRYVSKAVDRPAVVIAGYYSPCTIDVETEGAGGIQTWTDWIDGMEISISANVTAGSGIDILHVAAEDIPRTFPIRHLKRLNIVKAHVYGHTLSAVEIRGSSDPTNPADGIIVQNVVAFPAEEGGGNAVRFRGVGYYGDTVRTANVIQYGDSTEVVDVGPGPEGHFKSRPSIEHAFNYDLALRSHFGVGQSVDNAPLSDAATLLRGAIIENRQPSSGEPAYWMVTSRGTEGTITGVTGAISASGTTLTLTGNDGVKVANGMVLSVAGAGPGGVSLTTRVIAISADFVTCTVDLAASTTVSGAAVTRRAPTKNAYAVIA